MHALIVIGRTPAARDWPDAAIHGAAILGLSADEFATRVIAAAPVTVRESVDRDAVEAVRQQLVDCGIDADVVASDGIQWHIEMTASREVRCRSHGSKPKSLPAGSTPMRVYAGPRTRTG